MQDGRQQLVDLPALALSEGQDLQGAADAAEVFGVVPTVAHDAAPLGDRGVGS